MKHKLLLIAFTLFVLSASAQNDYRLLLQSGTIQPAANTTTFINESNDDQQELFNGYYYRLIQFNTIPTAADKERISRAGLLLLTYIPNKAFITAIPQSFDKTLLSQLNVRSVVAMNGIQKINNVLLGQAPEHARPIPGFVDVVIEYYQNIPYELISKQVQGYENLSHDISNHTIIIRIPENEVRTIAAQPWLAYMAPIGAPSTPDDNKGRSLHRSNVINSDYASGNHFDGTGVTIALADDGDIGPHIDFTGRVTRHTGGLGGTHGDMTSGICIGAGNLNPINRGMATGAHLQLYDISGYPQVVGAVNNFNTLGTVITSTSYSQGSSPGSDCNIYTADTEFGDNLIFNNPQIVYVFSAGNQGTGNCGYPVSGGWGTITGGYKTGKNVITVGNLTGSDGLDATSSRGPLSDGRLKPDICSNGNGQISCTPDNTYQSASTATSNGTSGACPGIAGLTAQLYQAYKSLNGGNNPPSGLIKACMLNSAEDLGNPGPDYSYGWGRVNVGRALTTLQQVRYITDTIAQGEINTHNITVPAGVSDLRVMLYWMDPAGTPVAAVSLVNDLNMHLSDPVNIDWNPWRLDPTPVLANITAVAVRGNDSLNNMEQVTVPAALQGTWTITVDGFAVPMGPQSYFIVYEYRTQEIDVTYPQGGEGFVSGEQEIIRWDAVKGLGAFTLEYTINGGQTWTLVSNSINQNLLQYTWPVPAFTTGKASIRVSRGGFSAESDTLFSIIAVPQNIQVDYACVDSLQLTWNAVPSAIGYTIYQLGSKYMDVIGTSNTNSFVVHGTNPVDEYWFSVSAITVDSTNGRRAIAIHKDPGLLNCPLTNDAALASVISPNAGTLTDCQGTNNLSVIIKIINNGVNAISNIPVGYFIGLNSVNEIVAGPIQPGDSLLFTFATPLSYPFVGTYSLNVWLNIAGDQNGYNDTITVVTNVTNGTIVPVPFTENFDAINLCSTASDCEATVCPISNGWINAINLNEDDIDFRVSAGATPSTGTGPANDHTLGNASGRYIYLEASACFNKTSFLLSPCIDLSTITGPQLSFWYNMSGAAMGELHLDILASGALIEDIMSPISGDQGTNWQQAVVDLSAYAGDMITLRFRGITGADFTSDMALDDINIIETNIAPAPAFAANFTTSCVNNTVTLIDNSLYNPTSWEWTITPATFSFVNGTTANSQYPQLQFAATGVYDIKLKATNIYGTDSLTIANYINIIPPATLSLTENFEGTTWPPSGWRVEAGGNNFTWQQVSNVVGITGAQTKAAKINNFDYSPVGGEDGLARIQISLAGATNPIMTFERAYVRAFATPVDGLRIDVSTDCGNSYVPTGYFKQGATLATGANVVTSFTPTSATQWRKDTLNLISWVGQDITLKFVNISGSNNNLFLDNINIGEFSGINELPLNALINIYPNPSIEGVFNITVNGVKNQPAIFSITDVEGRIVEKRAETINENFNTIINLQQQSKGVYFLEIRTNQGVSRFRLSVI